MNLHICTGLGSRPPLLLFLDGLDKKLRTKICFELAMLEQMPLGLIGEPHVKHFSLERYRGLYELRAKSKVMVRIIFTQLPDGKLLLLHPFEKKQARDTERALETALKLMGEYSSGRCAIRELTVDELEADTS